MTEIRFDVELAHPPERVWRALTDPGVLGGSFRSTDLRPVVGQRFRLSPRGLAGFDGAITGEVLEADAPRRLVLRWRAPELDARLAYGIVRTATGCHLALRHSGFLGIQGTLRRRVLHRTYAEMLGRHLPEVLDRLAAEDGRETVSAALAHRRAQHARGSLAHRRGNAARQFHRGRSAPVRRVRAVGRVRVLRPLHQEATFAFEANTPPAPRRRYSAGSRHRRPPAWRMALGARYRRSARLAALSGRARRATEDIGAALAAAGGTARDGGRALIRWPAERRGRAVAIGASLLLVIGLVSVIVAAATGPHPAGAPQVGGGNEPGYAEQNGGPGGTDQRAGPGRVAAATTTAPSPPPVITVGSALVAAYRTESVRLGGYRGAVTVTNPGATAVTGWTVVITLPLLSLAVREAAGAQYSQEGRTVTFVPTADTRPVQPGRSVVFTFEVDGVDARLPTGCTIDGRPCSGIPE